MDGLFPFVITLFEVLVVMISFINPDDDQQRLLYFYEEKTFKQWKELDKNEKTKWEEKMEGDTGELYFIRKYSTLRHKDRLRWAMFKNSREISNKKYKEIQLPGRTINGNKEYMRFYDKKSFDEEYYKKGLLNIYWSQRGHMFLAFIYFTSMVVIEGLIVGYPGVSQIQAFSIFLLACLGLLWILMAVIGILFWNDITTFLEWVYAIIFLLSLGLIKEADVLIPYPSP